METVGQSTAKSERILDSMSTDQNAKLLGFKLDAERRTKPSHKSR